MAGGEAAPGPLPPQPAFTHGVRDCSDTAGDKHLDTKYVQPALVKLHVCPVLAAGALWEQLLPENSTLQVAGCLPGAG